MSPQTSQETISEAHRLGRVLIISSGETAPSAHDMHQRMFEVLPAPIRVAILETPAGFELNSAQVAGKVGDFLRASLQDFSPVISVIPARRRDGLLSSGNAAILSPMLEANYLFLGPGSPTYAVRHLRDTLALRYLLGRHRQGATLCFASAAAVASSAKALPVYEIFKAGHDLHWVGGLDFFGAFGLDLAIVTHWDNREGGAQLDTSHCFVGRSRMERLRKLLPPTTKVLGIDEHTAVVFDFEAEQCEVIGKGGVALLAPGSMKVYGSGERFPIHELGPYHVPAPIPVYGPAVTERPRAEPEPPPDVLDLVRRREALRKAQRWPEADAVREEIVEKGFEVQDTEEGPRLIYKGA